MILYRIQVNSAQDWKTEWHPTLDAGNKAFTKIIGDLPTSDVYLDEVDVTTGKVGNSSGRDNVAWALNNANVERTQWTGSKELKKRVAATETIEEDFLLT